MKSTHSEAKYTYIHPYASQMGFPPLGGGLDFSAIGIFPTQRNVCTFCYWDFSHSETVMQMCLWAFLDRPTVVKTLCYRDFSLSESPTLLQEFSPFMAPVWCSATGIFPTQNTNTRLQVPPYLNLREMNTSIYPYSAVGFSSLGRQFRCAMSPTWRITPLLCLLPLCQIIILGRDPYLENTSNLSMGCNPYFKPLLCRYREGRARMC